VGALLVRVTVSQLVNKFPALELKKVDKAPARVTVPANILLATLPTLLPFQYYAPIYVSPTHVTFTDHVFILSFMTSTISAKNC
jgi:hypothetical protein